MGLATRKQRIASNLPEGLSSYRFGSWFLVYKPQTPRVLAFGLDLFSSKFLSWKEKIFQAPLRRYLREMYQIGPGLFTVFVISQMLSSLQPALTLYYSNKLFSAVSMFASHDGEYWLTVSE